MGVCPRPAWPATASAARSPEAIPVQAGPRVLLLIVSLALLLGLGPRPTVAQPTSHAASDPWAHAHVPTDLLVSFRTGQFARRGGASPSVSASLDRYLSAFGVQTATDALDSEPVYPLRLPPGTDLAAKQRELLPDPNVACAEP